VSFGNSTAHGVEAVGDGAAAEVRAGDAHADGEEDFGDAAHADAANAYEVDVLLLDEHR